MQWQFLPRVRRRPSGHGSMRRTPVTQNIFHDPVCRFFRRYFRGVDMDLGLFGRFIRAINAGEVLELTTTSLLVKRSDEHTSELQSLMRISYAVFCLTKKKHPITT